MTLTVEYTGVSAACVGCGRPTTFQDPTTGEHRHLGNLCGAQLTAPAAPGPREGTITDLQPALIPHAVRTRQRIEQLAESTGGDLEKIRKKAIPVVMDLFEEIRAGGRYPLVHHPPYPEILHKPSAKAAHQIWLARPKWTSPVPPRGPIECLDVPGAYLNAYTTWLPIQALRHDTSGKFDARQSGVYLIERPTWEIVDLPDPLGARDEDGPVWVAGPTLRQLQRCHVKHGLLADAPKILEAWTAPATEDMLTGLRRVLAYLRSYARRANDILMAEMVKDMYAKFYATCGESNDNHRLRRPEWNCIIQAQAHANLWERAYKARQNGLQIIRVANTDEIHLVGDWRMLWTEGHELTQMKTKED